MKCENIINLEERFKVHFIQPEFINYLLEGYELYKDNDKIQKKEAAEKRKLKKNKYANNPIKLQKEHLDFIKSYLDNE